MQPKDKRFEERGKKGIMENFTLLGDMREEEAQADLFRDLNLNVLFDEMNQYMEEYDLTPLFMRLPKTKKDICFRQELLREIDEEFETQLWEFYRSLTWVQKKESELEEVENSSSRAHWHLLSAHTYFAALEKLVTYLEKRPLSSEGWQGVLVMCKEIMEEPDYVRNFNRVMETYEEISKLRYSFRIEGDHVAILPREAEEDFLGELYQKYPQMFSDPNRIANLLPGSQQSTKLEQKLYLYLRKKHPAVFKNVEVMYKECPDFFHEKILAFHRELSFYLSYLKFYRYMVSNGCAFCFPQFTEGDFSVKGGYDLALAFKNYLEGKTTVANDYYYGEKERFFIVTGPNQGGKTTFGRSAGQLVYFALLGFPVPAEEAQIPCFEGVMTHFSVEESMESGRGKLKEELARLAEMVDDEKKKQFVVINELFTSAATFDALEMGHKVINYFLRQECYGIYVTHVDELAKENEQIVSMVATLHEGSDRKMTRTYKVIRQRAEGKGYVEPIVEQYGLGYDEIMRRLQHV